MSHINSLYVSQFLYFSKKCDLSFTWIRYFTEPIWNSPWKF